MISCARRSSGRCSARDEGEIGGVHALLVVGDHGVHERDVRAVGAYVPERVRVVAATVAATTRRQRRDGQHDDEACPPYESTLMAAQGSGKPSYPLPAEA